MEQVLIFASIISPITLALVELIKHTFRFPANYVPAVALMVGLVVGFASYPTFTDLPLDVRLWAGALGALAATGIFELAFVTRPGTTKQ